MLKKLSWISLLVILLSVCCKPQEKVVYVEVEVPVPYAVTDTVEVLRVDTVRVLTSKCIENEIRLKNIEHYVRITESNPKNRDFFFGWIRRAISE